MTRIRIPDPDGVYVETILGGRRLASDPLPTDPAIPAAFVERLIGERADMRARFEKAFNEYYGARIAASQDPAALPPPPSPEAEQPSVPTIPPPTQRPAEATPHSAEASPDIAWIWDVRSGLGAPSRLLGSLLEKIWSGPSLLDRMAAIERAERAAAEAAEATEKDPLGARLRFRMENPDARRLALDIALAVGPGVIKFHGTGPFGPIWTADSWSDVLNVLRQHKTGEVRGVLSNKEVGEVSLPYGEPGTRRSDGWGFSKIDEFHQEVVEDLPKRFAKMSIKQQDKNRIQMHHRKDRAVVRKDWNNEIAQWLNTLFEKPR